MTQLIQYRGAVYRQARIPKYLYHGTSLHRWRQIEQGGHDVDLLYLAATQSGTEMYRLNAVQDDEADGVPEDQNAEVVVKFDLDVLARTGELMPDWDDVPTNMELFPDASWVGQVLWEDSLKKLGTCSYRGNLKAAVDNVRII